MFVTYLETVILYCLNQIDNERSISSVFHLLNGKKSSQTIQDAHFFKLEHLFQTFPFLGRDDFKGKILLCSQMDLVSETSEQHYQVTTEGKAVLAKEMVEKPFPPFLNGWKYHSLTSVFWERLSLLVQVCSNLIHHHTEYFPIQRKSDVQIWVKLFLQQKTKDRQALASELYNEIITCLDSEPTLDPSILVIRFTGHKRFGLTGVQAAHELNYEPSYYHLHFLNIIHYMIDEIHQRPTTYPLLKSIMSDLSQPSSFTISTSKTYHFIKQGFNLNEIANIRKLKRSTVEDHLVEIALMDKTFDISNMVPIEKQKMIMDAAEQSPSKQLKLIRELTDGASYFEIRLVLAKYGDSKWN